MTQKSVITALVLSSTLLIIACSNMGAEPPLPGKIAIESSEQGVCYIYSNSTSPVSSFRTRKNASINYSGFRWLNSSDALIATEMVSIQDKDSARYNVVKFNAHGRVIDTIYKGGKHEIIWPLYSSRDDKYLLVAKRQQGDANADPFKALTPIFSLFIVDIEKKVIINNVGEIAMSPNLKIEESPWIYNSNKFVYSIDNESKLISGGKTINKVLNKKPGVYMYDMASGQHLFLVSNASFVVASPAAGKVAYEKDSSIRILDIDTKKESIVKDLGELHVVKTMHWTPDGKYIYFRYSPEVGIGSSIKDVDKLISIETGNEVEFDRIPRILESYTWK